MATPCQFSAPERLIPWYQRQFLMSFTFFTNVSSYIIKYDTITNLSSLCGNIETQGTTEFAPPQHRFANNNGQRQVYFCVSCHVFYISYKSFIAILLFFNLIVTVLHGTGQNSVHRQSSASHPPPPSFQQQKEATGIFLR
jgi:hypothetical protein